MPELPEVEVVKRSLERKILNLIIKKVQIKDINLRYKLNKDQISKVVGKKIKKIKRRSKFLIFEINESLYMLVHLGMTGKFYFVDENNRKIKTSFYYNIKKDKDQKHDRVIFFLQNEQKLIYNDVRKFGFIKFIKKEKLNDNIHLKKLGPEPLNKKFNFIYLKNYILGRKRIIKNVLMDQTCVGGLGNIYVNEILFKSKVNPKKGVEKLSDFEISRIVKNTKKILKNSISLGGSSIKNFSSGDGKKVTFNKTFMYMGKKVKSVLT